MFKPFIWLVFFWVTGRSICAQSQPNHSGLPNIYSVEQLLADWDFYRNKLESTHPNLNLYTAKTDLNYILDSLRNSITTPMTELDFYKHITTISPYIGDGHSLILPSLNGTNYHNSFSKFWPLQIAYQNGVWEVIGNYMEDGQVPVGANIQSINGLPMTTIWNILISRQVRDGHNTAYAEWVLQNFFREYYSYLFGHPNEFEVTYSFSGKTAKTTVQAWSKDSLWASQQRKNLLNKENNSAISWSMHPEQSLALLSIKTFHRQVLRHDYHQKFKREIKHGFKTLRDAGIQHLVLDLRDNQGGDLLYGVYLLAHLLDKPFKIVQTYQRITHGELVSTHGPCSGWHKPRKQSYTGKLDVWLNGGSFSNSVIVASCLNQHNRVNFYGSESGGNPHVLAGHTKSLTLPHTKIRVDLPTKRFVLTSLKDNSGRGIRPNHSIKALNPSEVVKFRPAH